MWVRIANFFFVAAMGMSILANYHISEQTRLAAVELSSVDRGIVEQRSATTVLQAKWEQVAGPARIQALAQTKLGMNDAATAQLTALEMLPRHGDDAPLGNSEVRQASTQAPSGSQIQLTPVSDKGQ
jgi:hypothetical protein